jgi:ABC-2 type transport system ATP-binding protein/lipopolysaccharide transport system ATP-binding protein
MRARLAFSVATSVTPQILLIDEGIGTADAAFTAKATTRLRDFYTAAGILVMASHQEALVRAFCTTGAVLHQGRLVALAPIGEALATYQSLSRDGACAIGAAGPVRSPRREARA